VREEVIVAVRRALRPPLRRSFTGGNVVALNDSKRRLTPPLKCAWTHRSIFMNRYVSLPLIGSMIVLCFAASAGQAAVHSARLAAPAHASNLTHVGWRRHHHYRQYRHCWWSHHHRHCR
jgi:hypothetical protein